MITKFTPEQTRVLMDAVREANPRGNRWIPAGCGDKSCCYNDKAARRCTLNNYQRQSCDTWKKPVAMPAAETVVRWVAVGLILLVAALALAIYWPR